MRKVWFLLPCSLLLLIAISIVACGNGNGNRQLQSITVSPASARSQAQFTATGKYTDGSTVSPLTALWSQDNPWIKAQIVPVEIVVDSTTGMASCGSIAGTFTVDATAPVDPHFPVSQMQPTTPQVSGTAQLTCP